MISLLRRGEISRSTRRYSGIGIPLTKIEHVPGIPVQIIRMKWQNRRMYADILECHIRKEHTAIPEAQWYARGMHTFHPL